jgi:predicted TPR repeat methyltransferase
MIPVPDLFKEYEKAESLLAAGDLRKAADLCKYILDNDPEFAYGYYLMSALFMKTGNLDKALVFVDMAIKRAPDIAIFHMQQGLLYSTQKKWLAAEKSFRKAAAIQPDDISAMEQLFASLMEQKKKDEAQAVMEKLLTLQSKNPIAQHFLAIMRGDNVETTPKEYVKKLFNDSAESFDNHMQRILSYNVPSQLADLIRSLPQMKHKSSLSLLDLGCGTGLVAETLLDITSLRAGVDLSQKMLDQAQNKQLYTELHDSDIIEFMLASDYKFDLVVAADVLVYIGNLQPFFNAVRKVLANEGLLAFSVEKEDAHNEFHLNTSGRYSHNLIYIKLLAQKENYNILIQKETVLRIEKNESVKGILFVLKKDN